MQRPNYKKHYDLLTYCHLCSNGAKFNFSLYDPHVQKNCNWTFHKDVCPDGLETTDSICIPYVTREYVDYPFGFYYFKSLNKFLAKNDLTHTFILPLMDIHIPHTCTILFWSVLTFTILFIAIPEVFVTFLKLNLNHSFFSNLITFFGFRIQSILWVLTAESIAVGFFTMYSIDIFIGNRQKTLLISGLIISLFISLFAYLGFISLWIHIIETSDSIEPIKVNIRNK